MQGSLVRQRTGQSRRAIALARERQTSHRAGPPVVEVSLYPDLVQFVPLSLQRLPGRAVSRADHVCLLRLPAAVAAARYPL